MGSAVEQKEISNEINKEIVPNYVELKERFSHIKDFDFNLLSEEEICYVAKYHDFINNNQLANTKNLIVIEAEKLIESFSQEKIDEVRKEVLDYVKKHKDIRNFDDRFVQQIVNDIAIRNYLARILNKSNISDTIINTIEFLTNNHSDLDDLNFPKEFNEFGVNCGTGFDRDGNAIFYFFINRNFAPKKLIEISERYISYLLFKMIRISLGTTKFFTLVMDLSNASVSNVDLSALKMLFNLLNDYAPCCLFRVICHNVHWLIKPIFKIALTMMPQVVHELVVITTGEEIFKYISPEQLSSRIEGGLNDDIIIGKYNENQKSFIEIAQTKHNMTESEAEKIIQTYRKALKKKCK